jgi:hypothetical protein
MAMLTQMVGTGASLVWRQPEVLTEHFDLHLGPADNAPVVATLDWARGFMPRASAACAAGFWTFERSGGWRPQVAILDPATGQEMARYRSSGGGGTLATTWGPTFGWVPSNFWRTNWDWLTADGQLLLHFVNERKFVRAQGRVDVAAPLGRVPELDLLSSLGWFLLLAQAKESSAATTAIVSS